MTDLIVGSLIGACTTFIGVLLGSYLSFIFNKKMSYDNRKSKIADMLIPDIVKLVSKFNNVKNTIRSNITNNEKYNLLIHNKGYFKSAFDTFSSINFIAIKCFYQEKKFIITISEFTENLKKCIVMYNSVKSKDSLSEQFIESFIKDIDVLDKSGLKLVAFLIFGKDVSDNLN